ncbi:vitamin K epoxide reductase family protein, partial [Rubripirellula sp.]|nr:vitamin K epoxide reductase family protein [Rubripirellula sp.]
MIYTTMSSYLTATQHAGHEASNQTTWKDKIPSRSASHSTTQASSIPRYFVAASSILGTIGLLASGYLGYVGLTASKVVGCDGGLFNCDHVLTSRWSTVMGIPVSLPAVALYAVVLSAIANLTSSVARRRQIAASVLWFSAVAA